MSVKKRRRRLHPSDQVPVLVAKALLNAGMAVPARYGDIPEWARLVFHFCPTGLRLARVLRRVVGDGAEDALTSAWALGGLDGLNGFLRGLMASRSSSRHPGT